LLRKLTSNSLALASFAGINYVVQAVTPFVLALLWSARGNYDQVSWLLFGSACLSALAFQGALVLNRPSAMNTPSTS